MRPMKVGITGGIGSGKTLVCQIFALLKIPIYYSDGQAKYLMNEDPDLRSSIIDLLGVEAYAHGQLDRNYVASKVFADAILLDSLNALVHPVVRKDFDSWVGRQDSPYVLNEAALHFESGGYQSLDFVISVSAPESVRIQRVQKRDGHTVSQIQARMSKQWPQSKKDILADHVIHNDGNHSLISQVMETHERLLTLSDKR